jgi:hypothetical protein
VVPSLPIGYSGNAGVYAASIVLDRQLVKPGDDLHVTGAEPLSFSACIPHVAAPWVAAVALDVLTQGRAMFCSGFVRVVLEVRLTDTAACLPAVPPASIVHST